MQKNKCGREFEKNQIQHCFGCLCAWNRQNVFTLPKLDSRGGVFVVVVVVVVPEFVCMFM